MSSRDIARNPNFTLEQSLWFACVKVIIGLVLKVLCAPKGMVYRYSSLSTVGRRVVITLYDKCQERTLTS